MSAAHLSLSAVCLAIVFGTLQAASEPGSKPEMDPERLAELIQKGIVQRTVTDAEAKEIESLFAALLPGKGAEGEPVRWEVRYSNNGDDDEDDLITLSLYSADEPDRDRLMWFHIVCRTEKPTAPPFGKVGPYPANRFKDRHAFALVNRTDVRAVATDKAYQDDAKIDKMILSIDLEVIKKL